jgi:hypothetical protein
MEKNAAKCENLSYLRGLYSGSRDVRAAANLQKVSTRTPTAELAHSPYKKPFCSLSQKHLANKHSAKHLAKCQLDCF